MEDLGSFLASAPSGWRLEILYKPIVHIYFRVYPHQKKVRVSAPEKVDARTLEKAIGSKSAWILKQVSNSRQKTPLPGRNWPKNSCYFQGKLFPLFSMEADARPGVVLDHQKGVMVFSRPGSTPCKKDQILSQWFRRQLKDEISNLLDKWQPALGVRASEFGVKKMKTRWGSCNTKARRIWINLALICLDPGFLEYVLVHELVHLLEPSHNKRFYGFLDLYLPHWQQMEKGLKQIIPGEITAFQNS